MPVEDDHYNITGCIYSALLTLGIGATYYVLRSVFHLN
jgi:hypothetical protein